MSLPMPSGSCWTKRTTESNRTAPEILRGFFAPYPPADASCRTSGHTPPNPLTFPSHRRRSARPSRPARYLPCHQLPHSLMALLSKPCSHPKVKPGTPHAFPSRRRRHAQASYPARYPRRSSAPIPAQLSSPSDLYKNPGSRPPPGFLVISGSVRFPVQRRLR